MNAVDVSAKEDVLTAVQVLTEYGAREDEGVVEAMAEVGVTGIRAELLVTLMPLAFGRVLLGRMGFDPPIRFSDMALVHDERGGRTLEFRLTDEPLYLAALELADEAFETGVVPRERYEAVVARSPELAAVSQALDEGDDVSGAVMGPPTLFRLSAAEGFDDWHRRVSPVPAVASAAAAPPQAAAPKKKRLWQFWK